MKRIFISGFKGILVGSFIYLFIQSINNSFMNHVGPTPINIWGIFIESFMIGVYTLIFNSEYLPFWLEFIIHFFLTFITIFTELIVTNVMPLKLKYIVPFIIVFLFIYLAIWLGVILGDYLETRDINSNLNNRNIRRQYNQKDSQK